jgi:hypothetical protein
MSGCWHESRFDPSRRFSCNKKKIEYSKERRTEFIGMFNRFESHKYFNHLDNNTIIEWSY